MSIMPYSQHHSLEYRVDQGHVSEEPHRTVMNTIDLRHFLDNHRSLFTGKTIIDLGCGESYVRGRRDLGFKEYVGVDHDHGCMPDIEADFDIASIPIPFGFDIVLALQILPRDIEYPIALLNRDGVFIHQSGIYMYEQRQVEERIAAYFDILEKIIYSITAVYPDGEFPTEIDNVFLIAKPKPIKSSSTLLEIL